MKTINKTLMILVISAFTIAPAGCKKATMAKALQNGLVERSTMHSRKLVKKLES
jgi:hypothetical protein